MKTRISTKQTKANIRNVLDFLANTPQTLARLREGVSDEQLRQPLGPGERSFTEDLAHLINSEARTSEAVVLALLADEPFLIKIHPERQYGKLMRFDRFPFSELFDYFKLRRAALLGVLRSLTEEQWSRTVREEGKKRRESAYWRARAMALHEHGHLSELDRKLGDFNHDEA